MSKFQEALSQMSEEWNMSQGQYDQQFGGAQIDEGVYEARLQSAKMRLSKASGNLMIAREHLITKGELSGRVIYDQLMMTNSRNLVYVRHWIEMMGYECPSDPTEIEATVEAIANEAPDVKVRVSKDGEYTNAEVIELLGVNASTPATEESSADASAKENEAGAEPEYTLQDLIEFCGEVGIDLTKCDLEDPEAVMGEIKGYAIPTSSMQPGRKEMLLAVGLEDVIADDGSSAEEAPVEETEETEDTRKDALVQFCVGQGIDYDPNDSVEILVERIDAFTYPEEKLTAEEKALLIDVGLEKDIVKPAPAAKKALPAAKKAATPVATKAAAPIKAPAKKAALPPVKSAAKSVATPSQAPAGKKLPPKKK